MDVHAPRHVVVYIHARLRAPRSRTTVYAPGGFRRRAQSEIAATIGESVLCPPARHTIRLPRIRIEPQQRGSGKPRAARSPSRSSAAKGRMRSEGGGGTTWSSRASS